MIYVIFLGIFLISIFGGIKMKKTLGTIVLAGLLFLAGCGASALSAKSISGKLTKEPAKVSVIYVDPASGIQRETITDEKDVVNAIADELKTLSTKVVKDKVSFNQKDTAFGVEVADKDATYNVTLYYNGYMRVQKLGGDVVVYSVTDEQIEKLNKIWSDYMSSNSGK